MRDLHRAALLAGVAALSACATVTAPTAAPVAAAQAGPWDCPDDDSTFQPLSELVVEWVRTQWNGTTRTSGANHEH